jgi:iron complex outermembrane receptor protein
MLQAVATTASRRTEKLLEAPAQISVVSADAIAERPAPTLANQLLSVPGLSVSTGGLAQSNIVSRGFNNAFSGSMLMLQDYRFAGVPSLRVNVPFLFTGTNEDVERIEVLNGPASALFGPNSGNGVLHVITKSPFSQQGTTVTMDGGTQSQVRVGLRTANQIVQDKLAYKLSGEYYQGLDFRYADPGEPARFPSSAPGGRAGQPNVRDFTLQKVTTEARVDWRPADDVEAITTYGYTRIGSGMELTGANGTAQIRGWTYQNLQQRFRWGRLFAQAFINASNAGNEDRFDGGGTFLLRTGQPIVDKSTVFSGQLQHGVTLGNLDLTYGADYIATTPVTGNTINGRNEDDDNVREYGAYAQGKYALTSKFDLLGAVRADQNNVIDGTFVSPRAALLFKPTENQNFRLTYNRAFSTPANFAFFLDLPQSANLGGTGYNLRAVGNPPKRGWAYDNSCGGPCFRSVLQGIPGVTLPAGNLSGAQLAGAYPAVYAGLASRLQAGLVAAGVPAPQAAAIVAALNPAVAGAGAIPPATFLGTRTNFLGAPSGAPDLAASFFNRTISPLKAAFNNTYELGWKGTAASNKLAFDIAAWYQERADVGTPAGLETPSAFFTASGLSTFYNAALAGAVPDATQRAQIAGALAAGVAQFPLGTAQFDNPRFQGTDLIATYSILDRTIYVGGLDVQLQYAMNDHWTLEAMYSHARNMKPRDSLAIGGRKPGANVFTEVLDSRGAPFAMNAPIHRAVLTFRWRDGAWGSEFRGRYADAFPVNSGVYSSYGTFPTPGATTTYSYPTVPVSMMFDWGLTYRFRVNGNDALFALSAQNVFDNLVPTFVGVPALGRVVTSRLSYSF